MTPASFLQKCVAFKPENWHTRSLSDEPVFTATEEKLIRLGLDPAAHQGESDVCAIKLFRSLRRRDVTADRIIQSFATATWAARELSAARGYVVNFVKYKGRTVGELPRDYLEWAFKNCHHLSFNLRRAMQIILERVRN